MPENKKESKVEIFVGYYNQNVVFKSDVYQPIMTADFEWDNQPDIIRDNTSINIADRNKHYAEISGHYWVWKNFLPNTSAKYVGFAHYRRSLDFDITPMEDLPFKPIYLSKFKKIFKKYTQDNILKCINEYDIVLPKSNLVEPNVYQQYEQWHHHEDLDAAILIIKEIYPEYIDAAIKVIAASEMYTCLNFIMKTELMNEYMEWIFNILFRLEAQSDWSKYVDYLDIRTPAFLAERLFNIWLVHNVEKRNLRVLNTSSILVVGKNYGLSSSSLYVARYKSLVKELNELKNKK